jgi:hypothetical protein
MFFQQNEANNNTADYFKSLKYKQFRNRVYNMNAKHNQGIWFRIGKKSNNHDLKLVIENIHYENLNDKLLNVDYTNNQSIAIKSDKNEEYKIKEIKTDFFKSLKPKSFRDRVYHMNFKYNQGIWLRIG